MPIDHDEILTIIATNTSNVGHVAKTVDRIEKNQEQLTECFHQELGEIKKDIHHIEKGAVWWKQVGKILGAVGIIGGIVFGIVKIAIALL